MSRCVIVFFLCSQTIVFFVWIKQPRKFVSRPRGQVSIPIAISPESSPLPCLLDLVPELEGTLPFSCLNRMNLSVTFMLDFLAICPRSGRPVLPGTVDHMSLRIPYTPHFCALLKSHTRIMLHGVPVFLTYEARFNVSNS